jgi:hypothetical protein
MFINQLSLNRISFVKNTILKRHIYIDPEDGLYFREYLWKTGSFGDNQTWYDGLKDSGTRNCHPFLYGWETDLSQMTDWVDWYASFESKKPKNVLLNAIYSQLIEPVHVEQYFYYESKETVRRHSLIKKAIEEEDYETAYEISFQISNEAEMMFSCYLYDTERQASINYLIEYCFSFLFWDFIFFWGITTYIMLLDIRWGFYTLFGFFNKYLLLVYNFITALFI